MKIEIQRLDAAYHLRATNEDGNSVETDGALSIGGNGKGMRPMQMLLASLGGCSSIDVIQLLKKQRQDLKDIRVTLTGEREADQTPALFTSVHVHFDLFGDLDENKVQRAVSLSIEKYCSVARILEKTAKITWGYTIKK